MSRDIRRRKVRLTFAEMEQHTPQPHFTAGRFSKLAIPLSVVDVQQFHEQPDSLGSPEPQYSGTGKVRAKVGLIEEISRASFLHIGNNDVNELDWKSVKIKF